MANASTFLWIMLVLFVGNVGFVMGAKWASYFCVCPDEGEQP